MGIACGEPETTVLLIERTAQFRFKNWLNPMPINAQCAENYLITLTLISFIRGNTCLPIGRSPWSVQEGRGQEDEEKPLTAHGTRKCDSLE